MQFAIEERIGPGIIKNPDILRLHAQWQSCRVGQALPQLSDFDIDSLWCNRDLMLVERVGDASFQYLHYGANVSLASGFDMTGKFTSSFRGEVGAFFVRCYERCLAEKRALYTTNPATHAALVTAWERILLPLADDAGIGRYVLGYNRPLAFKHELLGQVLNAASDVIVGLGVVDAPDGRIDFTVLTVNRAAEELLGRSSYDLVGQELTELLPDWHARDEAASLIGSARSGERIQFEWHRAATDDEHGIEPGRPDCKSLWYRVTMNPFLNGVVVVMSDITRLKQNEQALETSNLELQRLANTDPLTGCKNRRYLFATGDAENERAVRYALPLSLLILDLDSFKTLNDRHGHAVGDRALNHLVQQLERELRANDTLGRLGGDEFAAILPHTTEAEAFKLANRLRRLVAATPLWIGDLRIDLSCSIGVAEHDGHDAGFSALMRRADDALLLAKRSGRNTVRRASD
ncbi:MAG: sensor domain-containing diguanylate cyclase [Gammaproteobacteria bacterium]|nr:sensor domain-containing diguanylate cyclase [Gammaproteobacteria bacterium]